MARFMHITSCMNRVSDFIENRLGTNVSSFVCMLIYAICVTNSIFEHNGSAAVAWFCAGYFCWRIGNLELRNHDLNTIVIRLCLSHQKAAVAALKP